ncbi:hypothetical protein Avbf_04431 [Armadillidium vulgare]|nr:hypothetical protein Avbf_04431 [Armadillidium vulgare]
MSKGFRMKKISCNFYSFIIVILLDVQDHSFLYFFSRYESLSSDFVSRELYIALAALLISDYLSQPEIRQNVANVNVIPLS